MPPSHEAAGYNRATSHIRPMYTYVQIAKGGVRAGCYDLPLADVHGMQEARETAGL